MQQSKVLEEVLLNDDHLKIEGFFEYAQYPTNSLEAKHLLWSSINYESKNCIKTLLKLGVEPIGDEWYPENALLQAQDLKKEVLITLIEYYKFPQKEIDIAAALWTSKSKKATLLALNPDKNALLANTIIKSASKRVKKADVESAIKSICPSHHCASLALERIAFRKRDYAMMLIKRGVRIGKESGDFSYRCAVRNKDKELQHALLHAGASGEGYDEEMAVIAALENDLDMMRFHLGICENSLRAASYVLLHGASSMSLEAAKILVLEEDAKLIQNGFMFSPAVRALKNDNRPVFDFLMEVFTHDHNDETYDSLLALALSKNDIKLAKKLIFFHPQIIRDDEQRKGLILFMSSMNGMPNKETIEWFSNF